MVLDYRLTYNIITIFLITLLIPYKLNNGEGLYNADTIISGIFLTLLYIFTLYLFMPKKRIRFANFSELFLLSKYFLFLTCDFCFSDSNLILFTILY